VGRFSERQGRQIVPPVDERAIMALAAEQHGVFALAQLAACGLTERAAQKRAEAGRLHRVHDGVYSLSPVLTLDGRRMAAVLSVGPDSYLGYASAGVAYGLLAGDGRRWSVIIDHGRGEVPGPPEVHVRRSRRLPPEDVTMLRGMPITTVARTLVDTAGEQGGRLIDRVVHEAEVADLLDVAEVLACIERNPGRRGIRRLKRALGVSALEPTNSRFVAAFERLRSRQGLPLPAYSKWIDGGDRLYECDIVYEDARLIIELDGEQVHRTRKRFHEDRRRDALLAARGWLVVRLTWHRVRHEAAQVADELRAIIALRTSGVGRNGVL
jgi:predicted transcriptional regulator of viral defense system